ncbi:MAG: hypothetical protein AB1Z23_02130 [Eubacteriales bacterium]
MMNKKLITISIITLLQLAAVFAYIFIIADTDKQENKNHINYDESFSQADSEYYVYFYAENCEGCNSISDKIKEYVELKTTPIYFVKMDDEYNVNAWYNWNNHCRNNDIEIGSIDKSGNIVFYSGESMEKYQNGTIKNKFGQVIDFEILIADEDYIRKNSNALLGKVYAHNDTFEIDLLNTKEKDIKIPGIPLMLHIVDGKVTEYLYDLEINEFLASNLGE